MVKAATKTIDDFLDLAAIDSSTNSRTGVITLTAKHLSTSGGGSKDFQIEWNYKGMKSESLKYIINLDKGDEIDDYFKANLENAANTLTHCGLKPIVKAQSILISREKFYAEQAVEMLNSLSPIVTVKDLTKDIPERARGPTIDVTIMYAAGMRKGMNEHDILVRIKSYYAKQGE